MTLLSHMAQGHSLLAMVDLYWIISFDYNHLFFMNMSTIKNYEYTLDWIVHHEASDLPILFQHISNNNVDKFTACSILHLSFCCIFLVSIFSPPGFCSRTLLTSLKTSKNKPNQIIWCQKHIIIEHGKWMNSPLWPVKYCHQYADFFRTSECHHQCMVFLETSEK